VAVTRRLPRRERPNVAAGGQAYALTVLTPVEPGHEPRLAAALQDVRENDPAAFERVDGTHFARWVIIDHLRHEGRRPPRAELARTWLLFACVLDGLPAPFLERLANGMAGIADAVWSHCVGYPAPIAANVPGFKAWVLDHQLNSAAFFAPYGQATVHDVRAALRSRAEVADFAVRMQGEPPDVLRSAFRGRFADPRSGRVRAQ
jgi:hypothetical protein